MFDLIGQLNPVDPSGVVAESILRLIGAEVTMVGRDRVPSQGALIIVSNHRSALDVPLIVAAVRRSVRFACHPYMGQAPILKDLIHQLGCIPLDGYQATSRQFFPTAMASLQRHDAIGIFPEGAAPMIQPPATTQVNAFQRGFAHLALRTAVSDISVLPIAICPQHETQFPMFPVRLLTWFDPAEPVFNQSGWHPAVMYHRVKVQVGRPYRITAETRSRYQGREARQVVSELTQYCHTEIAELLQPGRRT